MPLLAGAGAALVCALLAGGLALLGTQPARTIGARAPLPEAPVELARAEIPSDGPQEPAFSEIGRAHV